jgi:hypothetical protein
MDRPKCQGRHRLIAGAKSDIKRKPAGNHGEHTSPSGKFVTPVAGTTASQNANATSEARAADRCCTCESSGNDVQISKLLRSRAALHLQSALPRSTTPPSQALAASNCDILLLAKHSSARPH